MSQSRYVTALLIACLWAPTVLAQNALRVLDTVTAGSTPTVVPVAMDNVAPVQGFVLSVGFDPTLLEVSFIQAAGSAMAAELIVGQVYQADGGCTLGVVLDASPPFDGQTLPVGLSQIVAELTVHPTTVLIDTTTELTLVDGVFGTPPLSNILVENGFSIGVAQGLVLASGTLTLTPPLPTLTIENTASQAGGAPGTPVRIIMDNPQPVGGLVLAIAHDDTVLTLLDIDTAGTAVAAGGAEFQLEDINPAGGPGGTLGVVMDFEPPFEGQVIPPGSNPVADFIYDTSLLSGAGASTDLTFVDGVLGSPALDNVLVVSGQSVSPLLVDGTLTRVGPGGGPVVAVGFYCGPEGAPIGDILGSAGAEVPVCFYYNTASAPGGGGFSGDIQGLQLAVCFDPLLTFGEFSLEGSIVEAVGAEFFSYHVDNDIRDGDGKELVAGILLDALSPFDGQTLPQTLAPLLIGCIGATIADTAACDDLLPVSFCDGVDGRGSVPIDNIVVADFESHPVTFAFDCAVRVLPAPIFVRGDCSNDGAINLADSTAILGDQFSGLLSPCRDACDANDDGFINLADSVLVLNYLFLLGTPPDAPGPTAPGFDPTPDDLTCELGVCN